VYANVWVGVNEGGRTEAAKTVEACEDLVMDDRKA
jgi:hypothetical protein